MSSIHSPIRIITYLVPDIAIEYFELIAHYLEDVLQVHTILCYESRTNGPQQGKLDVFQSNNADIGKPKFAIVQVDISTSFSSFHLWNCIPETS